MPLMQDLPELTTPQIGQETPLETNMQPNDKINAAIANLRSVLEENVDATCVSVSIFFNSEGYEITENTRLPRSLERGYISMRNLKGDYIK